jgi:hypothetical protein
VDGRICTVAGAVPFPAEIANQGWSLTPTKLSGPVPVFVMLTPPGARLGVPTFAVQLKPVGLTASVEVATGAALVSPEPYTDVQAPAV